MPSTLSFSSRSARTASRSSPTARSSIGGDILKFDVDAILEIKRKGSLFGHDPTDDSVYLAARLILRIQTSGLPGIEFSGAFRMYINTAVEDVTVFIPTNFTKTFEGETTVNGARAVVISSRAPQLPGVPENDPSGYFVIMGEGDLTVGGVLKFQGKFRFGFEVTNNEVILRLDLAASLSLGPLGSISVDASAQIVIGGDDPGFSMFLSVAANNLGIDPIFTINGQLKLQINTRKTHEFVAVSGEVVPEAGDSGFYFLLAIEDLKLDLIGGAIDLKVPPLSRSRTVTSGSRSPISPSISLAWPRLMRADGSRTMANSPCTSPAS